MELPSLSNIYVKVALGLALAAAAVAIIAVPIVYVNHRIVQAFTDGKIVGKTECEKDRVKKLEAALVAKELTIAEESKRADQAEKDAAKFATDATKTKQKLKDALAKTPEVTGCAVNDSATDVLRDALNGDFESADGDTLPKPFDSGVRERYLDLNGHPNPLNKRSS